MTGPERTTVARHRARIVHVTGMAVGNASIVGDGACRCGGQKTVALQGGRIAEGQSRCAATTRSAAAC